MEEFKYVPVKTAYESLIEQEGVPLYEGYGIEDVTELARKPWARLGGTGCYIQLKGNGGLTGMYSVEIPSGGALKPERHLYDKLLYVLKGRGATEVWQEGQRKQVFEWGEGSLFAPPLNTWHRLVNGAREPAILLAVTTAPLIMDIFRDPNFVFNADYQFKSRYNGEENYFNMSSKRYKAVNTHVWETNFIPDARTATTDNAPYKISKGGITCFEMADNTLVGHISEWPEGIYHKGHYHGAGAVLLVLQARGYVLIWPKELGIHPYQNGHGDKVVKFHFKPGSVYSPPDGWFHQHFNTDSMSARHVALRLGSRKNPQGFVIASQRENREGPTTSLRQGGTVIDYEDEDPEIRRQFEEAIKKSGVTSKMVPVTYRTDPLTI
jgi:quercetin dioxygenase-like cupin family protein